MKKKIFILGVSMLLLAGCGEKVIPTLENGEEAIVTYNDGKDKISVDDLYAEMKDSYALQVLISLIDQKILEIEYKDSLDDAKESAESTIEQLKASYGGESKLLSAIQSKTTYSSIEAYQEALELNYLQNQAIVDYAKDKITEKQIKKYYEDEIVGDVKISHILFTSDAASDATDEEKKEAEKKALEEAEKVLKELDGLKGEELTKKFSELAKEYSDDESTKDDGGSLGYINKGTLGTSYQAVEDEAYKLKNGEVSSEVVKTSIGYHIILRADSKEKASLEDVKDTILEDLSDEYLSENADASIKALQELRKKYDVDIIDTELHTQYANYIQNALLAVQTNAEQ